MLGMLKIVDLLDRASTKSGPAPGRADGPRRALRRRRLRQRAAAHSRRVDVSSAGGGGARVDELMRSSAAPVTPATLMNAESSRSIRASLHVPPPERGIE